MNLAPNIETSSKLSHLFLEDQGDQAVWWAQAHLPNEGFGFKKKSVVFWFLMNFSFFQSSFRFRKVSSISDPFSGAPFFWGKNHPKPHGGNPGASPSEAGKVGWPPVKIYQCHALSFCFNKQPLPEKAMTSTAILVALYISRMISDRMRGGAFLHGFFSLFSGSNLTVAHGAYL